MAMDETEVYLRNCVKAALKASGSHGFDHIERVTRLCEIIGRQELADMRVLIPAALLHDIARPLEESGGLAHEEEGARIAEDVLRNIRYDETCISQIAHAIRTHRYRSDKKPETPEAKILSDADKLDAMGATGIARTFMRAGEHEGEIRDATDHITEKLLNLQGLLYTQSAREIGRKRHEFLKTFLEEIQSELDLSD
jgi:uncharacterized protein